MILEFIRVVDSWEDFVGAWNITDEFMLITEGSGDSVEEDEDVENDDNDDNIVEMRFAPQTHAQTTFS